jgi:creatinine amidohydrolase
VLPVGSFEQHGDHLPLATDTIIAAAIAAKVAHKHRLLSLPPVAISCSHEHSSWPGTVSISASTLVAIITDIATSLRLRGLDRLIVVNGHGGNYVLQNIVQQANVTGPVMALFPGRDDWDRARADAGIESTGHDDMHAGELETALMLFLNPELVRDSYISADHEASGRPYLLSLGMQGYTTSGVIGRPSRATAEKGRRALESLVNAFAAYCEILDL